MRVALAGPVDLELLQPGLTSPVRSRGYPFPMTAHLARSLVEHGHDVCVVTLDPTAREPYRLQGGSLEAVVVPMRPRARDRALDAFRVERRMLADALRDAAPDLVHAHWTYEFALAALRSRLPTLVTVHDWAPAVLAQHRDVYRAVRLGMQIRALSRAEHLTAVSPYIQHKVTTRYRKACVLVPNGLADRYYDVDRHRHATGDVTFGCLVTGNDRRKNVPALLKAFAQVRRSGSSPVRLRVAGGGCGAGEPLQQWAVEQGLAGDVEFCGRLEVDDVPAYLGGLDVFVHPSREESFGMVLAEAMAAGVPVVGGATSGAVPWLLDEGRAGILADVGRPTALADAMRTLLDPEVRAAWSVRARERAEMFRLAAVALRYAHQYARVLD